jgi:ribonuclease VapC
VREKKSGGVSKPGDRVIVLDTWAMLAYLHSEPAAQEVRQALRRARRKEALVLFSIINYGECLYVIEREHDVREVQRAIGIIDQLGLRVIPADRSMVFEAAHIKACYPISYADAFSVALARRYRGRVMTGDPEFKAAEREVAIHWLPDRRSQMRLPTKTKIPKP